MAFPVVHPLPRTWRLLGAGVFLLLLTSLEFVAKMEWGDGTPDLSDALLSALLVFSLFVVVFLLVSFVPERGPVRWIAMSILHVEAAALVAILFVSWMTDAVLKQPLTADSVRMVMSTPLGAVLHMAQSAPVLLASLIGGLCTSIYLGSRALEAAAGVRFVAAPSHRVALSLSFLVISGLTGFQLAQARQTRSAYGVLLSRAQSDPRQVEAASYSCLRSARVALATPTAEPAPSNAPPVIVIMIESLRWDLLRTYPDAIPFLRQLSTESLVFDKAYATATHSDYADLAFWYSRYPLRAEGRLGYPRGAGWRGLSVFELFKLNGYTTAYISSQNERWGEMINWLKIEGVDRFIDSEQYQGVTWVDPEDRKGLAGMIQQGIAHAGKVEDTRTLQIASEWAKAHATQPFFLGLNLQNTHFGYVLPAGGEAPFQPAKAGSPGVYAAWPRAEVEQVRNRFLNAAFNVDLALRRFKTDMHDAGVWDRAVVLIVGDGGEAFYEHGRANHSGPVFDEAIRTLAIMKLPKGDARNGTVFDGAISHVQFAPALLDVAGLKPWSGFQGSAPWQHPPGQPVFMSVNALTREDAVLRWPWKLIRRKWPSAEVQLFNLEDDPGETDNRSGTAPDIVARLSQELQAFRQCQISYYADQKAWSALQPPRYQ